MKSIAKVGIAVAILTLIWYANSGPRFELEHIDLEKVDLIRSANLFTDYEIDKAFSDIDEMDLNTVNLPIRINIENLNSSYMEVDKDSVRKAEKFLEKAKRKNLKIMLEPYPWISNGVEYETDWNPENKEVFFENWEAVLMEITKTIANPYGVEVVTIGSSLVYMEDYEEEWLRIIDRLREDYEGLITYKTGWWYYSESDAKSKEVYNKKLENKIFGELDFISIASYFELSDKEHNTVEELVGYLEKAERYNRNQNVVGDIEKLSETWGKQVLFGELGFPKRAGAAMTPWSPLLESEKDEGEQERCFKAYSKVFEDKAYFLGYSIFGIGADDDLKTYYPSEGSKEIIKNWR